MSKTLVTVIPGIGKTFAKDFARVDLHFLEDFHGASAETVFQALTTANRAENHNTSKNYLYVIRVIVYYAEGGRETGKLKWSFWKD